MQKMTFTSNQTAFEYAIYEIVGSYFKKATCISTIQEQKLIVHFKEQKQDTQCLMENKVDGYVKGVLLKKLPEDLWEEEVTVEIRKAPESDIMNIIFYGEKYALIVKGAYRGKNNAEFNYRFFTK
ncbi:MAG: hypothetical protein K5776_06950 [Lachnospiraceae bacterium]|nr:hypothetical protein [Lachnospiraceae bacterium]